MSKAAKVLIVDDFADFRELVERILNQWGYQTEAANDGVEGLQKVRSFKPDIVLADLQMPRMDGLELLEKARAEDPGIGFFLMSGQGPSPTPSRL